MRLGERFGQWPWSIEDEPTDRVLYYLAILGVEGQAGPGQDVIELG